MQNTVRRLGLALVFFISGVGQCADVTATLTPVADRKPAADFALKNANGKTIKLSGYRGKVVVVDFWATECGGCVKEIPSFMELADAYRVRPFSLIGVSVDILYEDLKGPDEAWARVRPFVRTHQVNYPILMGDDQATKGYNIPALPLTCLIDKRGRIAAMYAGIVDQANLRANIELLLKEPKR